MGTTVTSADDPMLLQKFKELHGIAVSPLYSNSGTQESSINFPTLVGPSTTYHTEKTSLDAGKLTAHWVPAKGRSGIQVIHEQHGLGIHQIQNNYASAHTSLSMDFNPPLSPNNYHDNIDPQLWGTKEVSAHLSGVMGGYQGVTGDKHMT
jgi:hypothetical protein